MIGGMPPRERLIHLPTPLEPAPRLSSALGIDLLIKREDLAGLCVGGNKARLLEFVLGALGTQGIDTLIAAANVQSNKLRDIAAASARLGLNAIVLIPRQGANHPLQGNRLLLDLLGAEVREYEPGLSAAGILALQNQVKSECAARGQCAAVLDRHLDYGTHATLAYVDAAREVQSQLNALGVAAAHVYITVGAGMTVSGLALGLKEIGSRATVHGICVARTAPALWDDVLRYARLAAERLGLECRLQQHDLLLNDEYLGAGYGDVNAAVRDAVRFVARHHGMVLDPVYNAKTAAALIGDAHAGRIAPGATVVLVNTGGGPGVFAASDALQPDADSLGDKG